MAGTGPTSPAVAPGREGFLPPRKKKWSANACCSQLLDSVWASNRCKSQQV